MSLPARPVLSGVMRKISGGLKEKGNIKKMEKEQETEGQFGISSLCFKTDLVTVVQRKQLMERQKDLAIINNVKDIEAFSNQIRDLSCSWPEPAVSEILDRLCRKVVELSSKSKQLAAASASLGSLRQELSFSKTVTMMVEYVELLTERYGDIHEQLLSARKVLGDNNIAIEKPVEAEREVPGKTRSVSMVSHATTARRVSCKEERSKSVTERDILENDNGAMNKNRKCSMFATISELGDKDHETETGIDSQMFIKPGVLRNRRKSSKKVSIAENLNCDYSDTNVSDAEDLNTVADSERHDYFVSEEKTEPRAETLCDLFQTMLFYHFNLDAYILHQPLAFLIYLIFSIIVILITCYFFLV